MNSRRIFLFSLSLAFLWSSVSVAPFTGAAENRPPALAIKNVRIFDGEKVIPSGTVVIEGGKITACGPQAAIPQNAEVIDGRGKTLLPGLVDAHVHIISPDNLKQALIFGVTTVIDMFTEVKNMQSLKKLQAEGKSQDMAYFISPGTLATAPGGHGTEYGFSIPTITRPQEAQDFVKARIAEGSDFIKIIQDDGSAYGLSLKALGNEEVAALVQAAHDQGKMAVIHAATLKNCLDALNSGADGLAHLYFDNAFDPDFGRLAARKKAFVIPTLSVVRTACGISDAEGLVRDADLSPYLKPEDIRLLKAGFPFKTSEAGYKTAEKALAQLREAGVPILAGTDAPNPSTVFGASLHRELALLTQAGLTPIEALAAATSVPAGRFHLSGRGRIREGLIADLLLVNGDPSVDITATRKIEAVWKSGTRVDRNAYRASVGAAGEKVERLKNAPAPENSESGWISDFEGDKITSKFGAGWTLSTDSFMGGKSQAKYLLVKGGAEGSRGALQITGEIVPGASFRWAGEMFSPGKMVMGPVNLSSKKAIGFWAKGDPRTYVVYIFAQSLGFTPASKTFTAGPEWKEYAFSFADFNLEGFDIMAIFIGAYDEAGKFTLTIDNVRLK